MVSLLLICVALLLYVNMESFADLGYSRVIKFFAQYYREDVVHEIQEKYGCCGALSPSYWIELPDSCCLNQRCDILSTLLIGCAPRFHELVRSNAAVIMWTSLGVSVAGLFGVILSYFIRNQHRLLKEVDECDEEDRKYNNTFEFVSK